MKIIHKWRALMIVLNLSGSVIAKAPQFSGLYCTTQRLTALHFQEFVLRKQQQEPVASKKLELGFATREDWVCQKKLHNH